MSFTLAWWYEAVESTQDLVTNDIMFLTESQGPGPTDAAQISSSPKTGPGVDEPSEEAMDAGMDQEGQTRTSLDEAFQPKKAIA